MKIKLSAFYQQFKAFVAQGIYDSLGRPNWSKGDVLFSKTVNGVPDVISGQLLNFYPIIQTDGELSDLKTASFATVFNQWERISLYGAIKMQSPEEAASWTYNATLDTIVCPVNSAYTTGFLSPEYYDNYTFEVELSSAHGDDDAIGVCVAYLEENGIPQSLMVYRTFSTAVPTPTGNRVDPVHVILNPGASSGTMKRIGGFTGTLRHADGTEIPAAGITTNGGHGGWNLVGPVRLKVERTATQVKIWATDFGSPEVYSDANSMVIDLTTADLKRFQQPSRIGYITYSQPAATFKVFQAPGSNKPIVDSRDNSMWRYENRAWAQYLAGSVQLQTEFPQGRLYSSTVTKRLYYTKVDGTLSDITPP